MRSPDPMKDVLSQPVKRIRILLAPAILISIHLPIPSLPASFPASSLPLFPTSSPSFPPLPFPTPTPTSPHHCVLTGPDTGKGFFFCAPVLPMNDCCVPESIRNLRLLTVIAWLLQPSGGDVSRSAVSIFFFPSLKFTLLSLPFILEELKRWVSSFLEI